MGGFVRGDYAVGVILAVLLVLILVEVVDVRILVVHYKSVLAMTEDA